MKSLLSGFACLPSVVVALVGVAAGTALPAVAASITNRDDREYKITIVEGPAKVDHMVKPQQSLEGVCPKPCILRLNDSDDDEYQIEPADIVSIEDGFLYYDKPDTPPDAAPQQGVQPPPQKKQ